MSVTAAAQRRPSALLFPSMPYVARVRPLARETTLSFVGRLAGRFGVSAADLIAEFFATGNRKAMSSLDGDGEVYFNAQARAHFAGLSRVPPGCLERALPAWSRLEPEGRYDSGPAATFYSAGSIASTTLACAGCTAVRTGRVEEARRYTEAHEHVCLRHRVWLTQMSGSSAVESGGGLSLAGLPSVVDAQRRHRALLRARSEAAQAFSVARAVVTTWWSAGWPQETVWLQRQELLAGAHAHVGAAPDAVRDAVTYPEAVILTSLLTSPFWQQRLLTEAGGHRPHTPADVPLFTRELGRRLERPWLTEVLAHAADGPLTAWLQACWRSRAGRREQARTMWWIAPAYRPANPRVSHRAARRTASRRSAPAAVRAESTDGAQGFARGLQLAQSYAAEHGHLCIPYRHEQDGFQLGLWLSNQRSTGPALSPTRSQALADLDPWWNPPWSTLWQRYYLRARQLTATGRTLVADQGFPGTSPELGSWLYRQCQLYQELHPQQRRLLAGIGIDADSAQHAQPRRRNLAQVREHTLNQARHYYSQHGHLCALSSDTQDSFPIGQVLANLRVRARRNLLDPEVEQQLTAMDPWWAPPWPSRWQRTYYTVRGQVRAGHLLDPANAFLSWDDELGQWLYSQCAAYGQLTAAQHELLAALGLTEQIASRAQPNPSTRRPSLETGLHYARSYVDQHGNLDVPPGHRQDGFLLGAWVARQRSQADYHAAKFASPWPAGPFLEALDPWWNPPWPAEWQTSYRGALALVTDGLQIRPQDGFPGTPDWTGQWLYKQCTDFDALHPEQQRRLVRLGITAHAARCARPRRIPQQTTFQTRLAQTRAWADEHGHLAAPANALHDGHKIGAWLNQQRQRAAKGRLPTERTRALELIDPHWNPPWGIRWQRAYHTARSHLAGRKADPKTGFKDLPTSTAKWLFTQCVTYELLHDTQHELLARLGVTATDARALRPHHAAAPGTPGPRPRPDTVPSSFNAGLPYARSYAHTHHSLGTADHTTEHDGFPLGWWLYEQRKHARAHHRRTGHPWPHEPALAALDPYWNPPWHISWQRRYTRLRALEAQHREPTPQLRRWLATQHRTWHTLNPGQQQLLTSLARHPYQQPNEHDQAIEEHDQPPPNTSKPHVNTTTPASSNDGRPGHKEPPASTS